MGSTKKRYNAKKKWADYNKRMNPKKKWGKIDEDFIPVGYDTAVAKGIEAENNVAEILKILKMEGLIKGYRQTKNYSKADRKGVDFWLFFDWGRRPLQVKSSYALIKQQRTDPKLIDPKSRTWFIVGFGAIESHLRRIIKEMKETK